MLRALVLTATVGFASAFGDVAAGGPRWVGWPDSWTDTWARGAAGPTESVSDDLSRGAPDPWLSRLEDSSDSSRGLLDALSGSKCPAARFGVSMLVSSLPVPLPLVLAAAGGGGWAEEALEKCARALAVKLRRTELLPLARRGALHVRPDVRRGLRDGTHVTQ